MSPWKIHDLKKGMGMFRFIYKKALFAKRSVEFRSHLLLLVRDYGTADGWCSSFKSALLNILPVGLMWPNKSFCSTECTLSTGKIETDFFVLLTKLKIRIYVTVISMYITFVAIRGC